MSGTVLDDPTGPRREDGATGPPRCMVEVVYDPWTLELAPLASQHPMSEYNRLKYGHRGSPVSYTPLSLHLPDVARALRERQIKYAGQPLWWPCVSAPALASRECSPVIPAAEQRAALTTGRTIAHPDLQQQLFIAISESIARPQSSHQTAPNNFALHAKTSETHPINVSQIIPPESLVTISSHLTPSKKPCPVLFEIDLPYTPNLIAQYPQPSPSHALSICPNPALSSSQHKRLSSDELRPSVTGALSAALNTKMSLSPLPVPTSRILLSLKHTFKNHANSDGASEHDIADAIPKSKSTPRHSTFPLAQTVPQISRSRLPSILALPAAYALHPLSHYARPTAPSPPNKTSKSRASKSSSTPSSPTPSSPHVVSDRRPVKLGNLLLSSCPGKKVRLSGPVRGRSAVCRDLDADLRRMKMLGARCVVCCLDDEELEFLIGASWTEYCQVAHREGLDVLRIPLPEGFAPLSPRALDADLDRIIEKYTLQGVSVLVHCRGGVGRAGLFACCWMLKLGLCGWIETDLATSDTTALSMCETEHDDALSKAFRWDSETVVRRDTLEMVERIIEVVRRRRSAKAIETLEQVQFLVEFVDYLRACGHTGRSACNSPSSS